MRAMTTLIGFRNHLLLITIGLYLLLNHGFMQLRIPPTAEGGIPIGELVLLLSLMSINYDILIPRIASVIPLLALIIWWILGFSSILVSVPNYGFWALRDASHVIESLFLLVGFAFAADLKMLERLFGWLKKGTVFICLYALGYPFAEMLQSLSPKLVAGSGYETSLFFTHASTPQMLLLFASYHLIISSSGLTVKNVSYSILAILMLGFAAGIIQGRTIYLQIIAIFLLLAVYCKRAFGRMMLGFCVLLGLITVMSVTGLQLQGRLSAVSLEFFVNHFLTIGGVEKDEAVRGPAGGVPQRLGWWWDLYERWTADMRSFFFGLGYGFPLVDFRYYGNVVVREPHNSYISIIARLGLSGILAFIWMHILLLQAWYQAYRVCRQVSLQDEQDRLLILLIFFVIIWVNCIGEDAFEKPFFTIPYYFFWGIVLRINWYLRYNVTPCAFSSPVPRQSAL